MTDERARLQEAIRDLSDPATVTQRVVDQALALVAAADGAVVELVDGEHLTYVSASGSLAGHVGARLAVEGSLSGLAVRSGETLYCEDAAVDRRVDAAACRRVGASSLVCVPLHHGAERIGALKVTSASPRAFSAADVTTLAGLAEFVSLTIGGSAEIARVTRSLVDHRDATTSKFVANVLSPGIVADLEVREEVERMLDERDFTIVGQPIVDVATGELVGVEALARFGGEPARGPDVWFANAQAVGLEVPLQLAAVERALEWISAVPSGTFLSINVGPAALATAELADMLAGVPHDRLVLELTEHLRVDDYSEIHPALRRLRDCGVRLAVDDTGAGYSSLAHVVNLAPDLIKLDRGFTRGIDVDPVRRAVAVALVSFARDTGANVVAEGIENADELATVYQLGIPFAQGYFIARPGSFACLPLTFPAVAERRAVVPSAPWSSS